jgi:lipopolysaccharide transport system permease protein
MGLLWSMLNPVLMLAVYTFVFSVVFQSRWPGGSNSKVEFALILFSGLIVYTLFSECFTRSPDLITSNVNYVKRVVFPIEVLPVVVLGTALFHTAISLFVWLCFYFAFIGIPSLSTLLVPVALIPLMLMTLGVSWIIASLGVYLRDIAQVVAIVNMILMFLSPIFYPISALPEKYRFLVLANPLAFTIEQIRNVLIWGQSISWVSWALQLITGLLVTSVGFYWFQKTRRGFSDVL